MDSIRSLYSFSLSSVRFEELVASVAESASALTLQEPDVSSPEDLLDTTSSEGSITNSPQSVLHNTTDSSPPSEPSLASKILIRRPENWYQVYYIRRDRGVFFCMYPNLGGPFQSIDEADDAIDRYLDELRRREMSKEQVKLSLMERLIHDYKYYLDGTPKRGPNSPSRNNTKHEKFYLVQALIHQYNEDHDLFGDHAHELEDLVRHEWIYEDHRWYYHFNFTIKKKEGNDNSSTSNLFFAEVSHMQGEKELEVNCCCMIKLEENGHCYGCRNNGSPSMKHPDNIGAYTGGHLDGYLPFGGDEESSEDEEAEDERLRAKLKGLDDPNIWDEIRNLTPRCAAKRNPGGTSLGSV
ncbi:unnamed protein product [Urochloa decumbens]|uniref:DUF3615 domain-containing protein n=1 Tax=Urochloa decumbens TaxID=240449 RepID=A0ABC9DX71_9POAL